MRLEQFAFFVCLAFVARADEVVTEGSLPVYSPDGQSLVFQRETPDGVKLGVCALKTRAIRWIDGAPGNAAQAAWHPSDGSLVYVYGNETRTAKEGFFAKERTGWNLRRWKDGRVTSLTHGRFMDYSPSFSPDGKSIYFASTRVPVSAGRTSGTVLYRMPASGGPLEQLTDYLGNSSGIASPSVSPDGRLLIRAELDSASSGWQINAAPLETPRRTCRVSAADLVAYSPRWSPDGRLLCVTGFRVGDAGWSVYLIDPRTRRDKKLFLGREPCFSPDGQYLAYVRDNLIRIHPLTDGDSPLACGDSPQNRGDSPQKCGDRPQNRGDRPLAKGDRPLTDGDSPQQIRGDRPQNRGDRPQNRGDSPLACGDRPQTDGDCPPAEQVLVTVREPKVGEQVKLPETCAFGDDQTFYVRFKGVSPATDISTIAQVACAGRYAESDLGFQIVFHNGGQCSFALRTAAGAYLPILAPGRVAWGKPVEVVGIRHGGAAYISVNGGAPRRVELPDTLALRTPRFLEFLPPYRGVRPTCRVERVEVGRGWPADVLRPCTLKELFP